MDFAHLVEQAASLSFQIQHETNKEVIQGLLAQLRWIDARMGAAAKLLPY